MIPNYDLNKEKQEAKETTSENQRAGWLDTEAKDLTVVIKKIKDVTKTADKPAVRIIFEVISGEHAKKALSCWYGLYDGHEFIKLKLKLLYVATGNFTKMPGLDEIQVNRVDLNELVGKKLIVDYLSNDKNQYLNLLNEREYIEENPMPEENFFPSSNELGDIPF